MQKIIYFAIIQQFLYLNVKVESLRGEKVHPVNSGELPFIAALERYPEGHYFCLGTLVTKQHVITASLCIENTTPEKVRVLFETVESETGIARYIVSSWLTYSNWADRVGSRGEPFSDADIAIIKLTVRISDPNVYPIRLSKLNLKQLQGKTAITTGWKATGSVKVLQKAIVDILSDEKCEKNLYLVSNEKTLIDSKVLCTAVKPSVTLDCGDAGAPVMDKSNDLVGINFAVCPGLQHSWGIFSGSFLNQYRVNLHFRIDHYRDFIMNSTNYH